MLLVLEHFSYTTAQLIGVSTSGSGGHYPDGSVGVWFRSVPPHTYASETLEVVQSMGPGNSDMRIRIGLFGSYWNANFGDDLMGLLFTKFLTERCYDVTVFRLFGYQDIHNIHKVNDIESLVGKADAIVIGGGGLLVPKILRSRYDHEMDALSAKLALNAKKRNSPIYAISVGGNGKGVTRQHIPPGWKALFNQTSLITVRNESDLGLAREFCDDVHHFPDILWLTPSTIELPQQSQSVRRNILINLPRHFKIRECPKVT